MSSQVAYTDPLQSLTSYILDIKPYHTKIKDITVELTYQELMSVSIADTHTFKVDFDIDYGNPCLAGYDGGLWDDPNDKFGGPDYRYSIDGTQSSAWCGAVNPAPDWATYVSPTTVSSSFSEDFIIVENLLLADNIAATVCDWTDLSNSHVFFDETIFDWYGFDWPDVEHRYLPIIDVTVDPTLYQYSEILTISDYAEQMNAAFTMERLDYSQTVDPDTIAKPTFNEILQITETILFSDLLGVNILDPVYTGSSWGEDWGPYTPWDRIDPDTTGWGTSVGWANNKGNWESQVWFYNNNGELWVHVPGTSVGGIDSSFGFEASPYDYNNWWMMDDQDFPIGPLLTTTNSVPYTATNQLAANQYGVSVSMNGTAPTMNVYQIDVDSNGNPNATLTLDTLIAQLNNPQVIVEADVPQEYSLSVTITTPVISINIAHNLGTYPIVRIFNNTNTEEFPVNITHTSVNNVSILFYAPFTGIVRLI